MRMPSRLRISIRRSDHVLRRTAGGIRVPEHHERQGNALRSVQVSFSWRCWNQRTTRSYLRIYSICPILHASSSQIEAAIIKANAISKVDLQEFSSTQREISWKTFLRRTRENVRSQNTPITVQEMPSNFYNSSCYFKLSLSQIIRLNCRVSTVEISNESLTNHVHTFYQIVRNNLISHGQMNRPSNKQLKHGLVDILFL